VLLSNSSLYLSKISFSDIDKCSINDPNKSKFFPKTRLNSTEISSASSSALINSVPISPLTKWLFSKSVILRFVSLSNDTKRVVFVLLFAIFEIRDIMSLLPSLFGVDV
jgi:hypothetical protein